MGVQLSCKPWRLIVPQDFLVFGFHVSGRSRGIWPSLSDLSRLVQGPRGPSALSQRPGFRSPSRLSNIPLHTHTRACAHTPPHLLYPPIRGWPPRSFPCLHYCAQCGDKHIFRRPSYAHPGVTSLGRAVHACSIIWATSVSFPQ